MSCSAPGWIFRARLDSAGKKHGVRLSALGPLWLFLYKSGFVAPWVAWVWDCLPLRLARAANFRIASRLPGGRRSSRTPGGQALLCLVARGSPLQQNTRWAGPPVLGCQALADIGTRASSIGGGACISVERMGQTRNALLGPAHRPGGTLVLGLDRRRPNVPTRTSAAP
jgi:hypothetical protein